MSDSVDTFERRRVENPPWAGGGVVLTVFDRASRKGQTEVLPEERLQRHGGDFEEHIYDKLTRRLRHAIAPLCVVSFMGCEEKGIVGLVAAERGRLAGQVWEPGDLIPICPAHAHDVYKAADRWVPLEALAEWLRADARRPLLAAFDAGDAWPAPPEHGQVMATTRMPA